MSLIKALQNFSTSQLRDLSDIKEDFQAAFEWLAEDLKGDYQCSVNDVATLVGLYAEYGAAYMALIAVTLEEPKDSSTTMKFMNSIIAEAVSKAGLHYFNLEHGFSIVDKAVQSAVDNGGIPLEKDILAVIQEIEDSYKEPSEEH